MALSVIAKLEELARGGVMGGDQRLKYLGKISAFAFPGIGLSIYLTSRIRWQSEHLDWLNRGRT